MKNSIALVLLVLLCQAESAGQPRGWYWQNPLPQGNNLYDICSDPTHAGRYIAVGDYGTILVKDDQYAWYQMQSGTTENLYSVCFSQTMGWIVGYNGTILHNSDGHGVLWTKQNSGTTKMLLSVHFTDFLHGWAVGENQTVLRTTDAGNSWNNISTTGTQHYFSVYFTDYLNGWIAGAAGYNGIVKKTTNGGLSWSTSLIPTMRMNSVKFINDSVGCVVGDGGRVYTTGNKGTSWSPGNSNTSSDLKDLWLKNTGEGWATGYGGTIIHTTDYGNNWTPQSSPTGNILYNVEQEYAVGWGGVILQIGDTSKMESSGFTHHIYGIDLGADAIRGYAAGLDGNVYYTSDAGATWIADSSGCTADLYAVDVISGKPGWTPLAVIVGERGTVLYSSSHLGWRDRSIPTTDNLYAVHRFYGGRSWVAGEWGRIWHTTNSGVDWSLQHENTSYHLNAIHFTSKRFGWAAGMGGTVLRTTNGGEDWLDVSPNSVSNFRSLYFVSSTRGWVVGSGGTILSTTDGGDTWVAPVTQVTSRPLNTVKFVNENIGWIAGAHGTILHTTDGGENWILQNSGCIGELWSMSFPDIGIGWIGGFDGVVLHTEDGGGALTFRTYGRESLDLQIPDPGEVSDTIEVAVFPRISSASVLSGITVLIDSLIHADVSDLILLLSHGGITDTLVAQGEISGSNIIACSFTDGSSTPIGDGETPYADAHKPHSPLSAFHGMNPHGEWKLTVVDLVSGNSGTLQSWGLRLYAESVTGIADGLIGAPQEFCLYQNYPNPFNPTTTIKYAVGGVRGQGPGVSDVRLVVYDILGREVATLVNERRAPGSYSIRFDGSNLASGVYIYRLTAGRYAESRTMALIK